MTDKEVIDQLRFVAKYERKREYNEINVGKLLEEAADVIAWYHNTAYNEVKRDTPDD